MSTPLVPYRPAVRVGDAERGATATRLHTATSEGRLTLDEADERLALAYAARTQTELDVLVADLPAPQVPPVPRRDLMLHAALVLLGTVVLVAAWAGSYAERPWFLWPVFWLAFSLFAHARRLGPWRRRP